MERKWVQIDTEILPGNKNQRTAEKGQKSELNKTGGEWNQRDKKDKTQYVS